MDGFECVSLEFIVHALVKTAFSADLKKIQIGKVMHLSVEEYRKLKQPKMLSQKEKEGENYLFWAFLSIQNEERKKFIFGQINVYNYMITGDYRLLPYIEWARKAYQQNWFDADDVRSNEIELKTDNIER